MRMIPSADKCFELMERYGMLDHIRAHSVAVEKIARIIAQGLRDAGVAISLEKVKAGALLHDIAKTLCLNSATDHAALGKEICLQHHMQEIAGIVGEHVRLKNRTLDNRIHEKEIVYYADKRVTHDVIVSLEERLEDLFVRYGKNNAYRCQLIKENFDFCTEVERKLFARLNFRPEHLACMIADL